MTFGGLLLDRVNVFGGDDDLGLNTIDLVGPASDRYAAEALDRSIEAPLRHRLAGELPAVEIRDRWDRLRKDV